MPTPAKAVISMTVLLLHITQITLLDSTDSGTLEVPLSWQRVENSRGNMLPDEIFLDFSAVTHEYSKLHLLKKPDDVEHAHVIIGHRGKDIMWRLNKHQHFSVYSDQAMQASFSVVMNDKDDTKLLEMFGGFLSGKNAFSVAPYDHSLAPGQIVLINGSKHIVAQEEHVPEQFYSDSKIAERGSQDGSQSYYHINYLLTDLENGINRKLYVKSGKQHLTLELFVVLDYSIYKKWLEHSKGKVEATISSMRFYYAHIINGINDRYESIDIPEMKISVKLAGYYIARSRAEAPFIEDSPIKLNSTSINVYKALDAFYEWIYKRFKEKSKDLPRFDATALFTDYYLLAKESDSGWRTISGVADIGSLCKINAVSINRDFGQYGTIDTATHEIGHNLGAQHDGNNNTCRSSDQFIMATSPVAPPEHLFHNPYKFSNCTIKYFKDYLGQLNRLGKNCMLDGATNEDHLAEHLTEFPGQRFTLDEQCQLMYGKESFYCAGGGDHGKTICRGMFCWRPHFKTCITDIRLRAADGTSCGNKSWCYRSKCVKDDRAPEFNTTCPHGDYRDKIPFWNTGVTECKVIKSQIPHLCYHQYYEDLCCKTCLQLRNTLFVGCEYGDRNKTACAVIRSNLCYDSGMQHECCETCMTREIKIDHPDCKYGDKTSWCINKSQFRASDCYRDVDRGLCCKTCLDLKVGPPGCEFGDRGSGCKPEHCVSPTHRLYCCKTCEMFLDDSDLQILLKTTVFPATLSTTPSSKQPVVTDQCSKDGASWCSRVQAWECYRSNKTCCLTCQKYFDPSKIGCEYGDKSSSCKNRQCGKTQWYIDNCCESCRANSTTPTSTKATSKRPTTAKLISTTSTTKRTTISTTKSTTKSKCPRGDLAVWCSTIKPHDCYRRADTCCSTCLKYLNESSKDCPYGDKRSDCTARYCSSYLASYCCKTCQIAMTTPRTTTIKTTTKKPTSLAATTKVVTVECPNGEEDWCYDLDPHECYEYFNKCCIFCHNYYNKSVVGCEFGDKELTCTLELCKESEYFAKSCCQTCKNMPTSTTAIMTSTKTSPATPSTKSKCPKGDQASWCARIRPFDCYRSSDTCCATCLQYFDQSRKDCEYGDRRSHCDATQCSKHSYSYYCCKTCDTNTEVSASAAPNTTTITTTRFPTVEAVINDVLFEKIQLRTTNSMTSTTTTTTTKLPTLDPDLMRQKCPKGDLASWCKNLKSHECYRSSKTCCQTCLKYYSETAEAGCEYGDKASWCTDYVRKSADECKIATSSVATKCCKSCKEAFSADPEYHSKLTYVRPTCSHGDQASFCEDIQAMGCYVHYKTCCRACAAYFDTTIPECPYGDKATWCKEHATSQENCNRKDVATHCCHTCFYLTSKGNVTIATGSCEDVATWCRNTMARQCYQPRAETACCATCKKFRKGKVGDCRYGDQVSWCEPQFCSSYPEECCATCA